MFFFRRFFNGFIMFGICLNMAQKLFLQGIILCFSTIYTHFFVQYIFATFVRQNEPACIIKYTLSS